MRTFQPKVLFIMADYGNDPTEVAIPYQTFFNSNFNVSFATEHGERPQCDRKMYTGLTGMLLGAPKVAVGYHTSMLEDIAYQKPLAWSKPTFDLKEFDLVFLPGGHEKSVKQAIESKSLHEKLANYVPLTSKDSGSGKSLGAICHGVQVLAAADKPGSGGKKSVIHDFETTALPGVFEQGIYYLTWLFLGDYYKTYGPGSPSVQTIVKQRLDDPKQFKNSLWLAPFVHEDPKYRYWSGRFPPDAEVLAKALVDMVKEAKSQSSGKSTGTDAR